MSQLISKKGLTLEKVYPLLNNSKNKQEDKKKTQEYLEVQGIKITNFGDKRLRFVKKRNDKSFFNQSASDQQQHLIQRLSQSLVIPPFLKKNKDQNSPSTNLTFKSNRNRKSKKLDLSFLQKNFVQNKQWNNGLTNMGNTCFFNSTIQMMMHCFDIIQWKSSNKSEILKKLLDLKKQTNLSLEVALSSIYSSLQFANKKESNNEGNDPVRVISSIIESSQKIKNLQELQIDTSSIKYGKEDYVYWTADNSDISFLFQSVIFSGYWCNQCQKSQLIDEQQNFLITISSSFNRNSIQDSLNDLCKKNIPSSLCQKCSQNQQIIDGFIKLPQFLFINLDQNLMGNIEINKQLKFKDQLREKDVSFNKIGFICHPKFHYTYVREERDQKFVLFNDLNVNYSSYHDKKKFPIKGILYSCSNNQDPNIIKFAKIQKY